MAGGGFGVLGVGLRGSGARGGWRSNKHVAWEDTKKERARVTEREIVKYTRNPKEVFSHTHIHTYTYSLSHTK